MLLYPPQVGIVGRGKGPCLRFEVSAGTAFFANSVILIFMKMNTDLEQAFNAQITLEFEASMVYRQFSIEMDAQSLPGMASWLRHQADEEISHANKLINHLLGRGNHPRIGAIRAPKIEASTALECFQGVYEHEQVVSRSVRALVNAADAVGDLDSRPILNWFLSEQIEEESRVSEIVGQLELTRDDGPGILRLDSELGQRPDVSTEASS